MKQVFKIFRVTPKGRLVVCEDGLINNIWIENSFQSTREAEIAIAEFYSGDYVILPVYIKY